MVHTVYIYILQACKIVLQLSGTAPGLKGYNELCRGMVVLMSCGIDYTRQTEDLQARVVVSLSPLGVPECPSLVGVCVFVLLV